jgi:hypothetical protein
MKRIDKVVLSNFKRHEQYIGKFAGNHFLLVGLNGAGKSTIIDAIKRTFGLKGKIGEPIRIGANGAEIQTYVFKDNEKYCLEEKFSKKSSSSRLKFYRVNGNQNDELRPALERFYDIFGKPIDFTPLTEMKGDEQFEFLKDNLGFDLSVYQHNYDAVYEDRTQVGREMYTLEVKLNDPGNRVVQDDINTYTYEKNADEIISKRQDVKPLLARLSNAEQHNHIITTVIDKKTALDQRIEQLERELFTFRESREECEKWLVEHPAIDPKPVEKELEEASRINMEIDQELKTVSNWNNMYRLVRNYTTTKEELQKKEAEYKEKTNKLKEIEEDMKKSLTKLPLSSLVPGLELVYINDTEVDEKGKEKKIVKKGLMLEGLPFNEYQHSYGKLLKAIIKMAAHFNADKLNFIPITRWDLLDPMSKQEILDFARDNPDLNIQFGIEKVDSNLEIQTEIIEFS